MKGKWDSYLVKKKNNKQKGTENTKKKRNADALRGCGVAYPHLIHLRSLRRL